MTKKDIKILILLWILGTFLALATGAGIYALYDPGAHAPGPSSIETPISTWVLAPATTVADKVRWQAAYTVAVIFPFLYGPLLTLLYIIRRFSRDRNPTPDKPNDNLTLEVVWTIIPAIVLIFMAFPEYHVLQYMEAKPKTPDQVVNITGAQFYWQYEYPRYGVLTTDDGTGEAKQDVNWPRFPVNKSILLNGQSFQVNHAWWVPAFSLKFDVIPGRVTTGWIRPTKEGYFKGQCAELCGALHAYMWIHVKVVSEEEFYKWVLKKGGTIPADEKDRVVALLGADYEKQYGTTVQVAQAAK